MNESSMYQVEKKIYEKLEGAKCALKLVSKFSFEFPEPDEHNVKEVQYYFIFDSFKQNMLQAITLRGTMASTKQG